MFLLLAHSCCVCRIEHNRETHGLLLQPGCSVSIRPSHVTLTAPRFQQLWPWAVIHQLCLNDSEGGYKVQQTRTFTP